MKKKLLNVLAFVFLILLVACSPEVEEPSTDNQSSDDPITEETFTGTIEEITSETSALVHVESGAALKSSDKIIVDLSKADENMSFDVGDQVRVTYDGQIRESYPAQINTLSIEKIE